MANDFAQEEKTPEWVTSLQDSIMGWQQGPMEGLIYMARAQGFRAGVRPNAHIPTPGDKDKPFAKRVVFIDFPEKTVILWGFVEETEEIASWLDSLPQYDQ